MSENGWKFIYKLNLIDKKHQLFFRLDFGDRKMSVEEKFYVEARCS